MLTRLRSVILLTFMMSALNVSALVVPFTEEFSAGNANWTTGNTNVVAGWSATGGVLDGAFISSSGIVNTAGFGTIVFRGNASADASGDAFVGDWLSGGVSAFSAFVRHDAGQPLNLYARLDAGAGRAGSSVDFSVPSGTWFQLNVPIIDSPSSFQSYGAGTFATVFSGIQNVQISVSAVQDPGLNGQTVNVDLANVATVPEPATWLLVLMALALLGCRAARRRSAIR